MSNDPANILRLSGSTPDELAYLGTFLSDDCKAEMERFGHPDPASSIRGGCMGDHPVTIRIRGVHHGVFGYHAGKSGLLLCHHTPKMKRDFVRCLRPGLMALREVFNISAVTNTVWTGHTPAVRMLQHLGATFKPVPDQPDLRRFRLV